MAQKPHPLYGRTKALTYQEFNMQYFFLPTGIRRRRWVQHVKQVRMRDE